jgi:hypothetical protein
MNNYYNKDNDQTFARYYWLLILAVIIKVLWGYWQRDMTFGDTSHYFMDAISWRETKKINIVWSPLYTIYFGIVNSVFREADIAVLIHRVLLILGSTLFIGWFLRRILPLTLSFLVVIWWVALPIHYDTLYEVHFFGSLISLLAISFCIFFKNAWQLPSLIALYGLAAVLVRNENIICFSLLLAYFIYYYFKWDRNQRKLMLYRLSVVIVASSLIIAYVYQHSYLQGWTQISQATEPKHRINMCQVYAFGYAQRHPEWSKSPWTECQGLMKDVFNSETPSITEMVIANPSAVIEHFSWNLSLVPAGFEVLLFNATSFPTNPDYAPTLQIKIFPTIISIMMLIIIFISTLVVYKRRKKNNLHILKAFELNYLILFLINVVMSIAIVLTQRPRPSYFLGFGLMFIIIFFYIIKITFPLYNKKLNNFFIWIAAGLIIVLPSYSSLPLPSKTGRLSELYRLIRTQDYNLCQPYLNSSPIAFGEYTSELWSYLCPFKMRKSPPFSLYNIVPDTTVADAWGLVENLQKNDIKLVVLDRIFLQHRTKVIDCNQLDMAFYKNGWKRLLVAMHNSGYCDAVYMKTDQ